MKVFLQKMPLLIKYLKSDNKHWQNIYIVNANSQDSAFFLDLGELSIDLILFLTVA